MNKVTTIHLRGKAYQIEEAGFAALRTYLDQAAEKLANDPDKDEIIADLEQAIAEKCTVYLSMHKNVITSDEVQKIITEMGPVDGTTTESKTEQTQSTEHAPKRLYQIREGAMISGVCNGLAAYFNIDVTIVRILFVVLSVLTSGAFILVYFVMAIIIPHADSPEQKAEAFGTLPITAQRLIDQARNGYKNLTGSENWKAWKYKMKAEAKEWKRRWKMEQRMRHEYNRYHPTPLNQFIEVITGIVWFLFVGFALWFLYNHVGVVREFFDMLALAFHRLIEHISLWLNSH